MLMPYAPIKRNPPFSSNVCRLKWTINALLQNLALVLIFHGSVYSSLVPSKIDPSFEISTATSPSQLKGDRNDQLLAQLFPSLLQYSQPGGNRSGSAVPLNELFEESRNDNRTSGAESVLRSEKNVEGQVGESRREKSRKSKVSVFHSDADDATEESPHSGSDEMHDLSEITDEDFKYYLTILLGMQEARCLEDFGATQQSSKFPLEDDLFSPFSCPAGPSSENVCDQCRNLTKVLPRSEDCQILCESSSWDCVDRCNTIVSNVSSDLKIYKLYKTITILGEEFNETSIRCMTELTDNECLPFLPRRRIDASGRDPSPPLPPSERQLSKNLTKSTNHPHISVESNFIDSVQVFCEGVTPALTDSPVDTLPNAQRHRPHKFNRHFILLKTRFTTSRRAQNYSNERSTDFEDQEEETYDRISRKMPVVFVAEQREVLPGDTQLSLGNFHSAWTPWKTLGKTPFGFDEIQVAYLRRTYQWRVTAVSSHGIVDRMTTEPFTTLNGYVEPSQPKKIYVVATRVVQDTSLDVLIGWDPPNERACFYKLVLDNQDAEEKPRTVRIRDEPLGVHRYWFENLSFGTNYGVRITSRSAGWHENESTHNKLHFITPTCLQVHHFRFDKCEPPPPRNLSSVLHPEGGDQKDETGRSVTSGTFTVLLTWLPPTHTNDLNVIQNYIVVITSYSLQILFQHPPAGNLADLDSPDSDTLLGPFHLQGNVTQLEINGLKRDMEYQVSVVAVSEKGPSPSARLTVSTKQTVGDLHVETVPSNYIYLSVPIATVLALGLTCHFTRNFLHRRKIKAARDSYFKSMEERDAMTNEWSIVPLNEEYSPFKLLDENFPKEKWDIGFQNLTIGDVIGQGAFGVVRRAKMPRKKYVELQHKHKKLGVHLITTSVDDDDALETVAVKMLKVAATKSDRDELIKEIVTMQNLGNHPQIVSLLGACTRGRSVCLVLEYCPGGDLLSFLRKVREECWPMLNLGADGSGKYSPVKTSASCSHSHRSSTEGTRTGSCESSQISYADIGVFSENSSGSLTGKKSDCSPTNGRNETGYSTTDECCYEEDSTNRKPGTETLSSCHVHENCRPISEKDVLSYARQISLGMAYLERNHVVHRDLACRNVLVMGDYKQVKISDFGLSRDIYTWNVYHQKTDGKLPVKWMAIESIFTHIFTSKSDVWSYGILLWELVTLGGNPYPAIGNNELFHLLKTGYRMERPENCSEELYALMRKCWRTAPADRPNFTELRRHLETMMEASDPTLYLSLQADIPSDYFSINARSDLTEIPLKPTSLLYPPISFGESKRPNKWERKYENDKVNGNSINSAPPERDAVCNEQSASTPVIKSNGECSSSRHTKPPALEIGPRPRTVSEHSTSTYAGTEVTHLSSNPVSPNSVTTADDVFTEGLNFVQEPFPTKDPAPRFRASSESTSFLNAHSNLESQYPVSCASNGAAGSFSVNSLRESVLFSTTQLLSRLRLPSLLSHTQSTSGNNGNQESGNVEEGCGAICKIHGRVQPDSPKCESSEGTIIESCNYECVQMLEDEEEEGWKARSDLNQMNDCDENPPSYSCDEAFPSMAINRAYDFNFKF